MNYLKTPVFRSDKWLRAVASLPCMLCFREGSTQAAPSGESEARLAWWSNLPLLAIDEFDRVNNTAWASERQFLLMDQRYEQAIRGKSITILASNTDPAKLAGYLYDRISDRRFEIIRVHGESYRRGTEWG